MAGDGTVPCGRCGVAATPARQGVDRRRRRGGRRDPWETSGEPLLDDTGRVFGILAGDTKVEAGLVVAATGPPGKVARMLGAERVADEPFGLAIRTYVESPRHDDRHLEACLTLRDEHGVAVPGYGWMFPAGDGTVNIGVGALSTMKGFKRLNLSKLLDNYRPRSTSRGRWVTTSSVPARGGCR